MGSASEGHDDRDLLDTSVNHILALEHRKLTLYRGGYSAFEKARNERIALDQNAADMKSARSALRMS